MGYISSWYKLPFKWLITLVIKIFQFMYIQCICILLSFILMEIPMTMLHVFAWTNKKHYRNSCRKQSSDVSYKISQIAIIKVTCIVLEACSRQHMFAFASKLFRNDYSPKHMRAAAITIVRLFVLHSRSCHSDKVYQKYLN